MATAQHCCNIQWGPWPEHWATLYMASCPNRQCCKPFRSSTTAFVISGSRANSPPSPCNVSPQRLPSPRRKPCSSAVPDRIGHTTIAQVLGYRRRGCKDSENCYYQQPVSPARNQGAARQPGSQPGIDLIGCSTTYDQPRQGLAAISSCSGRATLLRARRCSALHPLCSSRLQPPTCGSRSADGGETATQQPRADSASSWSGCHIASPALRPVSTSGPAQTPSIAAHASGCVTPPTWTARCSAWHPARLEEAA